MNQAQMPPQVSAETHRLHARALHIGALNPGWTYTQALKLALSEAAQPPARAVAVPVAVPQAAALEALAAVVPAAVKPFLEEAARKALEADVLAELECCVGWVRQASKSTDSLAKVEKATEMASRRASQAVARWAANSGHAQTARMSELSGLVQKEARALLAARAAAESAQRMRGA